MATPSSGHGTHQLIGCAEINKRRRSAQQSPSRNRFALKRRRLRGLFRQLNIRPRRWRHRHACCRDATQQTTRTLAFLRPFSPKNPLFRLPGRVMRPVRWPRPGFSISHPPAAQTSPRHNLGLIRTTAIRRPAPARRPYKPKSPDSPSAGQTITENHCQLIH